LALLELVKSNETCLKSATWPPTIEENTNVKTVMCDDTKFSLVEELLRPFQTARLEIGVHAVDARKAYKSVKSAFEDAFKVASKFETEQKLKINEVHIQFEFVTLMFRFWTHIEICATVICRLFLTCWIRLLADKI
jgi:hypothetical protein